jgi:uncharacterized membrane protein YdjX (TVP38/TMEM64 family)
MELSEDLKIAGKKEPWVRPLIKGLVLLAVLLSGLIFLYFSPVHGFIKDIQELKVRLASMGVTAPLFFTLGVFVLVFFGFPRLYLCFLGGMAFGFFWGLVWSQLGTILGMYIQFLFLNWGGGDFARRRRPSLNLLAKLFEKRGIPTIVLLRQIPMPGIFLNIVFLFMHVTHGDFIAGTLLGVLPQAIPSTLIGAGFMQQSFEKSFSYITGAIILLMLIWLFSGAYVRSAKNRVNSRE